jgi:hypothetical protein
MVLDGAEVSAGIINADKLPLYSRLGTSYTAFTYISTYTCQENKRNITWRT